MEYYLTELRYREDVCDGIHELKQLVKASCAENAKKIVKEKAIEEYGDCVTIFHIKVYETLIGD